MGGLPGPKLVPVVLSVEEREALESLTLRRSDAQTLRRTTAQALALRARIVLAGADGLSNSDVARLLGVSRPTVITWRSRFLRDRLGGLFDEPRPGRPRTVSDALVERVIVETLEAKPRNATHWSSRQMAAATESSQSTVSRIWRTFGVQPWRAETFTLSTDPLFIGKVRDVVGLYPDPPQRALVLCADEKSQIQALDPVSAGPADAAGVPQRRTHDYLRAGATSLFAALDAATGTVIGSIHRRHRQQEFLRFPAQDRREPAPPPRRALILDNDATHKTPAIKR